MTDEALKRAGVIAAERDRLHPRKQMADAQEQCVPCRLCGGKAIITDAGPGYGYYIECGNSTSWRPSQGCLIDQRRLGGWAYNVMEWWNRLHGDHLRSDSDGR